MCILWRTLFGKELKVGLLVGLGIFFGKNRNNNLICWSVNANMQELIEINAF